MNELLSIESAVRRTACRRRWQRAFRGGWEGLFAGSLLWLVALGLWKLFPIPLAMLGWAGLGLVLCPLGGALLAAHRRPSLAESARWLDQRLHLQERLSTALELGQDAATHEWRQLVWADAAKHARQIDPRQLLPFTLPRASRWALLVLAVSAGLGFVPEHRSQAHRQGQADAAIVNDTGRILAGLTRRELDERKPALVRTKQALERVQDLGERLSQARLTRSEALRDLVNVAEKLKEQAREITRDPAVQRLEQAARNPAAAAPADLQQKLDALQKELGNQAGNSQALAKLNADFQKLQQTVAGMQTSDASGLRALKPKLAQALADLSRRASEHGLSLPLLSEAAQALEASQVDQFLKDLTLAQADLAKLAQTAEALEQLKLATAQLGKDLAEQLEKGQATVAQATLQRMMQQLKQGQLSPEQLQKLLQEIAQAAKPGSEYGKVGECLKDAAEQMQQGNKPAAGKSLAKAAQELQRLMDQAGDARSLQTMLANLERASASIGTGQRWGQCPPGGHNLNPREGDSRPGTAAAALNIAPRDAALNEVLTPTKIGGQLSPGGSMPSITLKGVSIKGASKVQYEEAVAAAQADAQSALSQDRVPRAYQGAVREYFGDLRK